MGNRQRKLFKSCRSKIKYASREAAEQAITQGRLVLDRLDVYACRYCDGWHIGHDSRASQSLAEPGAVGVVATKPPGLATPRTLARRATNQAHKQLMRAYRAQERDDDA